MWQKATFKLLFLIYYYLRHSICHWPMNGNTTQTETMWTYMELFLQEKSKTLTNTWLHTATRHSVLREHTRVARTTAAVCPSLTFLGWTGGVDHWRKTHTTHNFRTSSCNIHQHTSIKRQNNYFGNKAAHITVKS